MKLERFLQRSLVGVFFLFFGCGVIFLFQQEKGFVLEGVYNSHFVLSLQAAMGDTDKQYALALRSAPPEAYKLYQKAALNGHAQARLQIATNHEIGHLKPELKDMFKAVEIYRLLAQENISSAQASLCRLHYFGTRDGVVVKDIKAAFEWCHKAIAQNDPEGFFFMSLFYLDSEILSIKDILTGAEYLRKSQEIGNYRASQLVETLRTNCFTPDSLIHTSEQARECLIVAALNDESAQLIVGGMYHSGSFFERDVQKAVYWLKRSATHGNPQANILLGILYARGDDGLNQDTLAAKFYFDAAIANSEKDEVTKQKATMLKNILDTSARMKGVQEPPKP